MTNEEVWQAVLAQIQLTVSPANFTTWFKSTNIVSINEGGVVISVSNSFVKEWLEQKYQKQILKILHTINEDIREIIFLVKKDAVKIQKDPVVVSAKNNTRLEGVGQLGFEEFKISKESNLNPKYCFDNFIVGPYNELAHAASWAVAKNPGTAYNPLFIYGGVGLGKTHLLQAAGNEIANKYPDKKVKYIPTEKFTSEIISSIKNGEMESLKAKYHDISVLIIDDIQFLANKEKTQEEFFHIFNSLYNKNKQIILSSDRAPKAIPALTERLRSRFEGGMIADVSLPDYETRLAILKAKCQQMSLNFPDDVLSFIASNVQSNIRELEGALTKLAAHVKFQNVSPDTEICKAVLLSLTPKKVISLKKVIQGVTEFYDLKEKDLMSSSRKKEIVKPRQVIMYLLREELKASFPFIGRKLGDKDHTTVIHAYKKIASEIKLNEGLQEEINLLKQKIYNS
ncbi:MAG TPA: chromosomal replication initiator protein DnaA [Candidatus Paceibacterota bacterium]|nr:chromosomal replication initiator protein DnaA [Candidatus Pacearchaeota archaeon]HRZ51191.1 chromosomal replication initiator protein DnaA [Candidatus Paceibacterota bacterium]HSA36913.1 chromosomal replication initiator protein DnaA [Candidatus Paceibacterota bacterium]